MLNVDFCKSCLNVPNSVSTLNFPMEKTGVCFLSKTTIYRRDGFKCLKIVEKDQVLNISKKERENQFF